MLPVQISKFSLQKRVKHPEDSWVPCPVNPLETLKATMKATNFTRLEGQATGLHGLLALTGCAVSPGIVWLSQMWLSGKGVDIWVISRWRSSWPWKMWRCYEAWLCGLQICKPAILWYQYSRTRRWRKFQKGKIYNAEEHVAIESFVTTLIHWTFFSDDANKVGICWLCRSGQLHVTPSSRWSLPRCHRSVRNDMRLFLRTKQYPVQLRTTKYYSRRYYSSTTKYYKVLLQY